MIFTKAGQDILGGLCINELPKYNKKHWVSDIFGPRYSHSKAPGPQAVMVDLEPGEVVRPHFHGTAQFQIFPAGSGTIGRKNEPIRSLMVQFKDHHTAYGPVVAGAQGLRFFAMRMRTGNSGPVYLDKPGYREKLQPSKRRNLLSPPLSLSNDLVLQHRQAVANEAVYPDAFDDGLDARLLRLGAGMSAPAPDPSLAGGLYLFVVNGSLEWAGAMLPLWSMVAIETAEAPFVIKAGERGLEVLVLQFPRDALS